MNSTGSGQSDTANHVVASGLVEEDDEEYELLQRNLSQYRKILKLQMGQKEASISFESRDNSQTGTTARSYFNSNTDSSVSSLANLGSPASPPRPTSPTNEVREILEQIRQIQAETDSAFFDTLEAISNEAFQASTTNGHATTFRKPPPAPSVHSPISNNSSAAAINSNKNNTTSNVISYSSNNGSVRRKVAKTNRNLYLPITNTTSGSNNHLKPTNLRNSLTSNCILNRGRGAKGWISKSAPTTPGTGLPGGVTQQLGIDDSSPLLDEHDEDAEQNA